MLEHKFRDNVTIDNFFIESRAFFKVCKKPKREPDYISYIRNTYIYENRIISGCKDKIITEKLETICDLHGESLDVVDEKYIYIQLRRRLRGSDKKYRNVKILNKELDNQSFRHLRVKVTYQCEYHNSISSRYWYGEDKKGKYVIRESDHWGRVASCHWTRSKDHRGYEKRVCAKAYL